MTTTSSNTVTHYTLVQPSGYYETITNTAGTGYEDYTARSRIRFDIGCDPGNQFLRVAGLEKSDEGEGINVLEKLADLIFVLNLSESDVKEIKKITNAPKWKEAVEVYMLARAVKDGLTAKMLDLEEED